MNDVKTRFRFLGAGLASLLLAGSVLAQVDTEPEAIFTMNPAQPVVGQPFRVDASQSFDRPANGPISRYVWTWGDGTDASSGVSVQHTYALAGRYTITLTVFDAANVSDSTSKTVNLTGTTPGPGGGNRAPTPSLIISPSEGFVDDEFTMDARASKDLDGDPMTFQFDFGDGDVTAFTSNAVAVHQYDEPGSYVVRLTVKDSKNASVDLSGSVRVLGPDDNQAPVALIAVGPREGAAPVSLSFDGRISYDPDGDPIAYDWSFYLDDEFYAQAIGGVVNQLFETPGNYSVVLEVIDSKGVSTTTAPQAITITEGGNPVEPPPPAPIPEPEDPPPSYEQRPDSVCGVGILMPMLACLMFLAGARRRN